MTRDNAREILGEGASEEQITNFLNKVHQLEKSKNDEIARLQAENDKYKDYDELKTKLSDIEKANLTREEQIALMESTAKENLAKSNKILNTTKAKEILAGLDLDDDTVAMLVTEDEATTIANANRLKAKFDLLKDNVEKQTKETLMNTNLKPSMSNVKQSEGIMTKEKFDKMTFAEQKAWKDNNLDKYHEFYPNK